MKTRVKQPLHTASIFMTDMFRHIAVLTVKIQIIFFCSYLLLKWELS